jgi:hypothetical protein
MKIYALLHWDAEDMHRMGGRGEDIEREIKLEAPRLYATLDLAKTSANIEANSYADSFPGTTVWVGEETLDVTNCPDNLIHLTEGGKATIWHYRVMQDGENELEKVTVCIAEYRIYAMEVYQ